MTILRLSPFIATLIGIAVGIVHWRYLSLAFRVLLIHLVVSGCVEIMAYALAVSHINNMWLLHIYTLLEFTALAFVFYLLLKDWNLKWLPLAAIPGFILLSVFASFKFQSTDEFNTYSRGTGAVLLIVFSVCYLLMHLRKPDANKAVHISELWFVAGVLLYFSIYLLAFFAMNFLINSLGERLVNYIWISHFVVCSFYYLIYAIALWKTKKI